MEIEQIDEKELRELYEQSCSGGILKIKKWFTDGKLEVLNKIHGNSLSEKIYRLLFPEHDGLCIICSKPTKLRSIKKGFAEVCSRGCSSKKYWATCTKEQENERQRKRIETNIIRYGSENHMQNKEIAHKISEIAKNRTDEQRREINNKRKQTNLKIYGVEFAQQLETTKEKIRQTNLKKFGVENPSQCERCKEKRKQTHIKKFGVENAFQSEEIKEKIRQTNLEKYGVENPSQSPLCMDKKIATHSSNYGVDYPAQHNATFHRQQKNKYKRKEITLPSGNKVKLQGYEPFALLNDLLFKYNENDIIMGNRNMPEIWYVGLDNKQHRYFPDFYISSKNKIIEVKSTYTMKLHLEKNFLKKARCLEMGFDFEFRIYDDKMNLVDEKEFL